MKRGGVVLRVLFLNEREILKELNGRLSYREKAIWTRSYFQDSGNNTSLSEFSGKKALFWIGTCSTRMLSGQELGFGAWGCFWKIQQV